MSFYTSAFCRGNDICYRGVRDDGSRIQKKYPYKPYLFMENNSHSSYKTIDGKSVKKIKFDSIKEANKFIAVHENISNKLIYGLTSFQYTFIKDVFPEEIEYDPKQIKIGYIDIEVAIENLSRGMDTIIRAADRPITAISLKYKDIFFVFGCGDFVTDRTDINYRNCTNEKDLLIQFLELWKDIDLDVISGWNVRFFDIPYLVRRISNVLGENEETRLSPWGLVNKSDIIMRGKEHLTYFLSGITILDYYELYRKFTFTNHESYKLHDIAQKEVGEGKLDYSEYDSLLKLYKNDFQKFIEYNIKDVDLVEKIEKKLGFLELVFELAYDAKVNYNDVMATIKPWDVIIHNYLMDRNVVIPPLKENIIEYAPGGAVKEPQKGFSNWVVSFDLTSLYPHLIMGYTISPDSYVDEKVFKNRIIELQKSINENRSKGNTCLKN